MKHSVLILLLAASTVAASAQAPTTPATPAAKPATTTAKPSTPAAKPATTAATSAKPSAPSAKPAAAASKPAAPAAKAAPATPPTVAAIIKAPANIPQHPGIQKPIFTVALRYQEIEIGTGAVAEPNKLYKVLYTGYRAADGVKFDSSDLHRPPLRDKDGKPVMGDDGKPKLGDPQPMAFPQGMGGAITGFDQGFIGMKVKGKRRIFIPWQLAYGTRALPEHAPDFPGIPAKSDLIFDVELVEVSEIPPMPAHPPMGGMRPIPGGQRPGTLGAPPQPAAPPAPGTAPKPPAPVAAPNVAAPSTPAPIAAPVPATAPKPAAPAASAPAAATTPAAPAPPQPK
jgi:peptidylprolyl isomerase